MKSIDKTLQIAGLLIVAFTFGGGGSNVGAGNVVVQLVALAILAVNRTAVFALFRKSNIFVAILIGATLALPLLQSIPLPPAVWKALPGRELVVETLELLGRGNDWFPFSVEFHRTLIAFLSLIPCLAILAISWDMPLESQRKLLIMLVAGGIAVVLLGTVQIASGNRALMLFEDGYAGRDLIGTFANRNSTGIYLVICLCLLTAVSPLAPEGTHKILHTKPLLHALSILLVLLLLTGLVLTRSRSSMALTTIPIAFAALRFWNWRQKDRPLSPRLLLGLMLGISLIGGGVAVLATHNARLQLSLERFDDLHDRRSEIWDDARGSIARFWPLGSGIGTFDEVFQVDESLEHLRATRAGRAHNDFIEVTTESGIVGIALLTAWFVFLALRGLQALRASPIHQGAAAVLVVLIAQSISDYPLRNQTLLCVAALMLAILIRTPKPRARPEAARKGSDHKLNV